MQEICVFVKGVVYKNNSKGFALSVWGVVGEPLHVIEHKEMTAYGAEKIALQDAVKTLCADDVVLHVFSNQKPLIDSLNNNKAQNMPLSKSSGSCDFTWVSLKDSPAPLLKLREMAMQEVEKRGRARLVN